jgi:hypothetical protein
MYEAASRQLLAALTLSPAANAFYARYARTLLANALASLSVVTAVGHVECSMPSVASGAEGPDLHIARYDGLHYSEWDVDWRPSSWWLSVAVATSLALRVQVRVSGIRITGRARCALPRDLSSVRVSFVDAPKLELQIQTSVELSSVPVPLQANIDHEIREHITRFVVSAASLLRGAVPSAPLAPARVRTLMRCT